MLDKDSLLILSGGFKNDQTMFCLENRLLEKDYLTKLEPCIWEIYTIFVLNILNTM